MMEDLIFYWSIETYGITTIPFQPGEVEGKSQVLLTDNTVPEIEFRVYLLEEASVLEEFLSN